MAGLSQDNLFKDVFNKRVITDLAKRILGNYKSFDADDFIEKSSNNLETLGFLERSNHIREMLKKYLPDDYEIAVKILIDSLGKELSNPGETDWDSFIVMPQCSFVSEYGKDHYDLSMEALYEMTKRFSAEGNIRTFLELDYDKTMEILMLWTKDSSPHVRRLVSEGTRPRLPLAGRIKVFQENPKPVIELLDQLILDDSLYVRRSVANNMNDIAKDNPEICIDTFERWLAIGDEKVDWIVRHGSRNLVKQGDLRMLRLLGYGSIEELEVLEFTLPEAQYKLGETVELSVKVKNTGADPINLMIDYSIHYVKSGGRVSEKVFKMRKFKLAPGKEKDFVKKHVLKNTSGRKHYEGVHEVELIINGYRVSKIGFLLDM